MLKSVAASPSNVDAIVRETSRLQAIRAVGGVAIASRADGPVSAIDSLHEYGGYRIKCPSARADVLEAVMINTGGGVAGGDRISLSAEAGAGSQLAMTTATAERIYRANAAPTKIDVRLRAGAGATLAWLPQASILFSGAVFHRHLDAEVACDASLLIAETTVYGRTASGEVVTAGGFTDQWRITREGRLVFAESVRLEGDVASTLARPAVAAGAPVHALLVCVAPDIEARREAVRAALADTDALAGVSAWNGLLVVRLAATRLDTMAMCLRAVTSALTVVPLPAAWTH